MPFGHSCSKPFWECLTASRAPKIACSQFYEVDLFEVELVRRYFSSLLDKMAS